MDVRRIALIFFCPAVATLLACAAPARALNMEYIPPEKKTELTAEFDKASANSKSSLFNKKWNCDMYGVRSGLQVQRNIKLYSLSDAKNDSVKNTGAQVVSEYHRQDGEWVGRSGQFEDRLRITSSGQLIARLSARTSPRAESDASTIIAYSICKSL